VNIAVIQQLYCLLFDCHPGGASSYERGGPSRGRHPGQPPTLENRGAHPLLLSQSYSNDQTATVPLHPGHGQRALATDGGHDLVLLGARLGQRFERSPALRSACVSRHRDLNVGREGTAVEMHALHFRNFMKRFFFAFPKCHRSVARRSRISAVRATLWIPRHRREKNASATDPTPRRHTTTPPLSPLRPFFFGVLSHSPALPPPPPPPLPPPTQPVTAGSPRVRPRGLRRDRTATVFSIDRTTGEGVGHVTTEQGQC